MYILQVWTKRRIYLIARQHIGRAVISKRSRRSLWPTSRQWLLTREITFRPLSQTSSPSTGIPHSTGAPSWHRIRLGIPGKPLLSIGGNASLIPLSGAPPPDVASLLMTISNLKVPSLRVWIASMFTIRRGVLLWSLKSPSLGTSPILGMRTSTMSGPISGFAMSSAFRLI